MDTEDYQRLRRNSSPVNYSKEKSALQIESNKPTLDKGLSYNAKKPPTITPIQKKKISIKDFELLKCIGQGSYGQVYLVRKKDTHQLFAMKCMEKQRLFNEKKQYQVYIEIEVLKKVRHPGIVNFAFSFQDASKLFIGLEFVEGGSFADFIAKNAPFEYDVIRFYSAEILGAIEHIHKKGIAHRDIKPDNIMMTKDFHLKIIDFGTAYFYDPSVLEFELYTKINKIKNAEKLEGDILDDDYDVQAPVKATFVGTAEYVSPELLEDDVCSASADLWALGCIIFKMFCGRTPFDDQTDYLIFERVKKGNYKLDENIPDIASDLISKLLVRDPNSRLGAGPKGSSNDFSSLKNHCFFEGIDFEQVYTTESPFIAIKHSSAHKDSEELAFMENVEKTDKFKRKISDTDELLTPMFPKKKSKEVFKGLVLKKVGWVFYCCRKMILKNNMQLVIMDPSGKIEHKEKISLNEDVRVEMDGNSKFSITTPNKKYFFKQSQHSAQQWVDLITETIERSLRNIYRHRVTNI